MLQGVASSALYWPADEVGSQTPGRLRPGDLSLHYTSCISCRSAFGEVHRGLCHVRQVLKSWWIRSSGESYWKVFRRSCGPPTRSVGPTDRSAGLLLGRTYLSGTAVSLVSGDPRVPMSHRFLARYRSIYICAISVAPETSFQKNFIVVIRWVITIALTSLQMIGHTTNKMRGQNK
jgi:hypothetical protein